MLPETKALLKDTQDFLEDLIKYLKYRNHGLEHGAQGDSRYVSFRLGEVWLANARNALLKINKLSKALPSNNWLATIWNKINHKLLGVTVSEVIKEAILTKAISKAHDYLLRAKEAIDEINDNSTSAQRFLPVGAHEELARNAQALVAKCENILKKHDELFKSEGARVRKSWLLSELRYDTYLIGTRVAMYGLSKSMRPFNGIKLSQQEADENHPHAVQQLTEIAEKVGKISQINSQPTKLTLKLMGCKSLDDKPGIGSLHYEYCPTDVREKMVAFKQYIDGLNKKAPEIAEVERVIKVNFPDRGR